MICPCPISPLIETISWSMSWLVMRCYNRTSAFAVFSVPWASMFVHDEGIVVASGMMSVLLIEPFMTYKEVLMYTYLDTVEIVRMSASWTAPF